LSRFDRRRARPALVILCVLSPGCGDVTTAPEPPALEVVVAGGDAQYGTPRQVLEGPLRAVVREKGGGAARKGVTVFWSVQEGDATLEGVAAAVTDSTGSTFKSVRLGNGLGAVRVRAAVQGQETAWADFQAFVVGVPELTALSVAAARPGDVVRLRGRNFSALAEQDVVLFSGIRGRVLSAAQEELQVEVPTCLPAGDVEVTVQLGGVVSQARRLGIDEEGDETRLDPGSALDIDDPAGLACLRLPADSGARYLAVVTSASAVAAASYGFVLRGLASPPEAQPPGQAAPGTVRGSIPWRPDFGEIFETGLRLQDAALVRAFPRRAAPPARTTVPATVPSVGDRRTFKVLTTTGGFDDVAAVVRYVGAQAALYVDETAPAGGFDPSALATLASEFDDVIYPTVTGTFGMPSDLDGNGRIAILFTPAVNRLTPRGSSGFVGGFFYGLDLLDGDGSNHGEIFYALVPDSAGVYSDPRSRSRVLDVTPAILAHEFQHMVHFNERVLKLGAPNTEAVWLSEGLAQMSEELVARAYERKGDPVSTERHREGNRTRARRFLADPGAVSLIVTTGQGSLEERGAGWLHVLYLWDRGGGNDVLGRLTRTTRTGIANVTAVMGEAWPDLVADWESAIYLDGLGPVAFAYEYPHLSLRDLLSAPGSPYPLSPEALGGGNFVRDGSLWASSARHYILIPPSGGSLTLRLGGAGGGNAPAAANLRLRIVRLS
jgi:hypothetical protein